MTEGKLEIFGGQQWRPLLHVRDAAQVIADNLATKYTGVFNLHSKNMQIIDLARLVTKCVPATKIDILSSTSWVAM